MLVATWLVAVVVASAIGFFAVGLVGAVLRDRGPIGVAPGELRGQPQSGPDTPAVRARFSYDAGGVIVECRGASVVMLEFAPAAGWTVVNPEMGPDEDVGLTFRRGVETFAVDVYCNESQPRAVLGG